MFLLLEFVCPMLGFYEFLKKDYVDQIIAWQFPSGCFGNNQRKEKRRKLTDGFNLPLHDELPVKLDLETLSEREEKVRFSFFFLNKFSCSLSLCLSLSLLIYLPLSLSLHLSLFIFIVSSKPFEARINFHYFTPGAQINLLISVQA